MRPGQKADCGYDCLHHLNLMLHIYIQAANEKQLKNAVSSLRVYAQDYIVFFPKLLQLLGTLGL